MTDHAQAALRASGHRGGIGHDPGKIDLCRSIWRLRYLRVRRSFSTPPIHSSIVAMSFWVTLELFGS